MAIIKTITAADAIFLLTVPGVFPVPQQLEGYAADAAFAFESVDPAETIMGVDGYMSAGYVPFMTIQTVSIMADSPSLGIFEAWLAAINTSREVFFANGQITLPAIGRRYTMTKGVLTGAKAAPDVKKVLQAVEYKITWQSIAPVPF